MVQAVGAGVTHVAVSTLVCACCCCCASSRGSYCPAVPLQPGDRVFVAAAFRSASGTYAQYTLADTDDVHKLPDSVVRAGSVQHVS